MISFTLDFRFPDDYVIPFIYIYFICVLTLLSSVLDTRTHPGSPPGIHIPTRLGSFTDSPGSSCPGFGAWSEWIFPRYCSEWRSGSVDLQLTVQSSILPGPCMSLEFPLSKLVSALFLSILVLFLVCLYVSSLCTIHMLYIFCTPAFAHICDMIFM